MLVTLTEMKEYLAEAGSSYNSFLDVQIQTISDAIEGYCGRIFKEQDYIQTFYSKDYTNRFKKELELYHYPVSEVTSVVEDDVEVDAATYRLNKPSGILVREDGFLYGEKTVVTYTAGFAAGDIPSPLKSAVYSLVEERYNKKKSGINLSFGNEVQRISIPGTLSVDFDYSLNNNERKSAFGLLLQGQLNVIDYYRSERGVIGSDRLSYVEVVPEEP